MKVFGHTFLRKNVFLFLGVLMVITGGVFFLYPIGHSAINTCKTFQNGQVECEVKEIIKTSVAECLQGKWLERKKQGCIKKLAYEFVSAYTIKDIQEALGSIEDSEFKHLCHEFMHYMGQDLYKYSENLMVAFSEAGSLCDSGMYHGIAEEYITGQVLDGRVGSILPNLAKTGCEVFKSSLDIANGYRALCYHGIGHGVMFAADYDLPIALLYCDYTPDNFAAESCYTGVFMENISTAAFSGWSDHQSEFVVSLEDITYPCRVLNPQYHSLCYKFQGVALQNRLKLTWEDAFLVCKEFPAQYQTVCIQGLGSNIPGAHMSIVEGEEICRNAALPIGKDAYGICIQGAIMQLGNFHTGRSAQLVEFCSLVLVLHQSLCWSVARNTLMDWKVYESQQRLCATFPEGLPRDICMFSK